MENTITQKKGKDDTAAITAEICEVSDNYVRKVVRGDRENDIVFTVFMELTEGKKKLIENAIDLKNKLVAEASRLVPFN